MGTKPPCIKQHLFTTNHQYSPSRAIELVGGGEWRRSAVVLVLVAFSTSILTLLM